jgi:phenylacetic acid degradation operon negative regulatory protein
MKSEGWLSLLLYVGDKLSRPTLRNLCAGCDEFEYRTGLIRALRRWEDAGLVEQVERAGAVVYRLTAQGEKRADGLPDPAPEWNRRWDRLWRVFVFDLPSSEHRTRTKLWRWLREHRFGYLQDSVWIRPHPVSDLVSTLEWFRDNPESFAVFEARQVAGGSDASLVAGAWDIEKLNARYREYLETLNELSASLSQARLPGQVPLLLGKERLAYAMPLMMDPLLPKCLWPRGYLGETARKHREQFLERVRNRLSAWL